MKYHNRKITTQDGTFDSLKEYRRWQELKILQKAGAISDLQRQGTFVLIPNQRDQRTGELLERAVKYVADFVYSDEGFTIVEDTKGVRTKEYVIKRKLMLERFGIRVQEI